MNLYDLSVEYRQLSEMLENSDIPEDVINTTLESIELPFEEKADNIAKLLRNLEAEETAFRNEIKRLSDRAKTLSNRQKSIKQYLEDCMKLSGKKKFKTNTFTFNIQRNKQVVDVVNFSDIPLEYLIIQEPKVDKKLLYEDLKAGAEIPGVELRESESLRIK